MKLSKLIYTLSAVAITTAMAPTMSVSALETFQTPSPKNTDPKVNTRPGKDGSGIKPKPRDSQQTYGDKEPDGMNPDETEPSGDNAEVFLEKRQESTKPGGGGVNPSGVAWP